MILFQIVFNEISKIISANRFVDHSLYADDIHIMCKKKKKIVRILNIKILDIKNWTEYSGAKISLLKTKIFHICRKHNCDSSSHTIVIDDSLIQNVSKLKLKSLGHNTLFVQ